MKLVRHHLVRTNVKYVRYILIADIRGSHVPRIWSTPPFAPRSASPLECSGRKAGAFFLRLAIRFPPRRLLNVPAEQWSLAGMPDAMLKTVCFCVELFCRQSQHFCVFCGARVGHSYAPFARPPAKFGYALGKIVRHRAETEQTEQVAKCSIRVAQPRELYRWHVTITIPQSPSGDLMNDYRAF